MNTSRIDAAIKAVCPIEGVSDNGDGTYRIDYTDGATEQQVADAQAVVAAFDFRPRREKSLRNIDTALQSLTAGERAIVQRAAIAWVVRQSSEVRALVKTLAGLDIAHDEVDA